MEMNPNNAEMPDLLAGLSYGDTGQCSEGQLEDDPLQQTLRRAHSALLAVSERPETFWCRQQAAIRSRIAIEKTSKQPIWGFLVATSALILFTLILLRPNRVNPITATQVDADDELLVAVEQVVQTRVPDALAPASLLSEETAALTQTPSKERHNAN